MAKPKLALIPASQGSKLFSILPSSGVGDFDFSRSGKATRINSQGLIEEVDDGVSRLNYPMIDGKVVGCPHHILEPTRTNSLTYSEDFSQSYWTKNNVSISSNEIISPDGTLNGSKVTSTGTTSFILKTTSSLSGDHTLSFYAKKGTSDFCWVYLNGYNVIVDLSNGTYVTSISNAPDTYLISNVGNGWYRVSITKTSPSADTVSGIGVATSNSFNGVVGGSIYIWGAQLEAGSYPTSYIPTNGEANGVTRAAEVANGSGDAATFNDSEGVLMVEMASLVNTNLAYNSFSIGSGTNNVLSVGFTATTNKLYAYKTDGSSAWLTEILVGDITSFNKFALRYNQNENEFWINGFKLATNNTIGVNPNTLSDMDFNAAFGGEFMYSKTKEVQYYNSELVDSELEQLTSWTSFTDMANGQLYTIE